MQRKMVTKLADPTAIRDFEGMMGVGLDLVFENATTIAEQAKVLTDRKGYRGKVILNGVADEEAAKFLILLDAVRCPKGLLTRQLSSVYSHLAKGVYAQAYYWSCNTVGELRGYIESEIKELYLDGDGEGQLWVCENDVIRRREEKVYVDLCHWGDTGYQWNSPKRMEDLAILNGQSRVVSVVRALHEAGMTAPEALKIVGKLWRDLLIDDKFDWWTLKQKNVETLQSLDGNGLLKVKLDDPLCSLIREQWFYPLYLFNLWMPARTASRSELREFIEAEAQRWWESMI